MSGLFIYSRVNRCVFNSTFAIIDEARSQMSEAFGFVFQKEWCKVRIYRLQPASQPVQKTSKGVSATKAVDEGS